jgi:hypothetical protein
VIRDVEDPTARIRWTASRTRIWEHVAGQGHLDVDAEARTYTHAERLVDRRDRGLEPDLRIGRQASGVSPVAWISDRPGPSRPCFSHPRIAAEDACPKTASMLASRSRARATAANCGP